MIKPPYSNEELAVLGEAVFARDIAQKLRGQDLRHFVAIEVDSGDYEVDAVQIQAIQRLHDRHPGAVFWIRRVGSRVANTMGGRLHFEPPWEP